MEHGFGTMNARLGFPVLGAFSVWGLGFKGFRGFKGFWGFRALGFWGLGFTGFRGLKFRA